MKKDSPILLPRQHGTIPKVLSVLGQKVSSTTPKNLGSSLTKTTMSNWKWFIPEKNPILSQTHLWFHQMIFPQIPGVKQRFVNAPSPSHQSLEVPTPALLPAHPHFPQGFYPSLCLSGERWSFKTHQQIPKKNPSCPCGMNSREFSTTGGSPRVWRRSSHPKYSVISGWTPWPLAPTQILHRGEQTLGE